MKRIAAIFITITLLSISPAAQTRLYQKGTVIRMRIAQCMATSGGIMAALAGQPAATPSADTCPEYTLVSDKVVYVVVSKSSKELIPLAENIDFRLQKNELLIHVDDTTREIRLAVRSMSLRPEWERNELERQRSSSPTRISQNDPPR
jgi:hypothetical protein